MKFINQDVNITTTIITMMMVIIMITPLYTEVPYPSILFLGEARKKALIMSFVSFRKTVQEDA